MLEMIRRIEDIGLRFLSLLSRLRPLRALCLIIASLVYFSDFIKLREIQIVNNFLQAKKGEKLLDIGCGWGVYGAWLARKGCQVYELDLGGRGIKLAKAISTDTCSQQIGDATALPYRPNAFDKCTCICALEHFVDDEKALTEMNKVLKSNAIAVLSVDSFSYRGIKLKSKDIHKRMYHVVNYYSYHQLENKLQNAGFIVKEKKFLFNSPIAAYFFDLIDVKLRGGYISRFLFPIAYSLSILSDHLLGHQNEGYILVIKAQKVKNV